MLWVKVLHLISVISWMAGLLYLPRLLVYHADAAPGSELSTTLKVMERRLLKVIMTPAMIATWVFGLWLFVLYLPMGGWIWVKLAMVVLLTFYHITASKWVKAFEKDENVHSSGFFRVANEVPTVVMVVIVALVVVKPF